MCCAMEYLHRKLIIDSQVAADRKQNKKKQKNKPIMAFKDGRGGDQPTKWFRSSLSTQKYILYINPPKLFVYLFPFQVKTTQHMRKAIKLTRHAFIEKTKKKKKKFSLFLFPGYAFFFVLLYWLYYYYKAHTCRHVDIATISVVSYFLSLCPPDVDGCCMIHIWFQ